MSSYKVSFCLITITVASSIVHVLSKAEKCLLVFGVSFLSLRRLYAIVDNELWLMKSDAREFLLFGSSSKKVYQKAKKHHVELVVDLRDQHTDMMMVCKPITPFVLIRALFKIVSSSYFRDVNFGWGGGIAK